MSPKTGGKNTRDTDKNQLKYDRIFKLEAKFLKILLYSRQDRYLRRVKKTFCWIGHFFLLKLHLFFPYLFLALFFFMQTKKKSAFQDSDDAFYYTLDKAALNVWRDFYHEVEAESSPGGKYANMQDFAIRYPILVLRLALLLAVVESSENISIKNMNNAFKLMLKQLQIL